MTKIVQLYEGDCLDVLDGMPENSVDAVVCDPPYHLTPGKSATGGFMGKAWDGGDIAFRPETWARVLRVLKPGGHLVAFGGTRTYHRLAVAVEDAGFECRDALLWHYGSGFPKSLDVSKAIDKSAGAERQVVGVKVNTYDGATRDPSKHGNPADQSNIGKWGLTQTPHGLPLTAPATAAARQWEGWGTALKPSTEIAVLARKPLSEGTVAANVLRWSTGALNIDATRVATDPSLDDPRLGGKGTWSTGAMAKNCYGKFEGKDTGSSTLGRWPANLAHSGDPEVLAGFPDSKGQQGDVRGTEASHTGDENTNCYGEYGRVPFAKRSDSGSAARFFYEAQFTDSERRFMYCAKANKADRAGSKHPTVKPVALMRWLVRMVTPPGGTVLDPFAGTGTTGQAAIEEGFNAILIERETEYLTDIRNRLGPFISGSPSQDQWLDDFLAGAEEYVNAQ